MDLVHGGYERVQDLLDVEAKGNVDVKENELGVLMIFWARNGSG